MFRSGFQDFESVLSFGRENPGSVLNPLLDANSKHKEIETFLEFISKQFSTSEVREQLAINIFKQPGSKVPPSKSDNDGTAQNSGQLQLKIVDCSLANAEVSSQSSNISFEKAKQLNIEIVVYFPAQFEALRMLYNIHLSQYIQSLAISKKINVDGGKQASTMIQSLNHLFVVKKISDREFQMFRQFAVEYFKFILKNQQDSREFLLVKIFGMYEVRVCNKEAAYYIVMENVFIDVPVSEKYIKIYDLKGSETNRLKNEGKVQLDTNFKINRNGEPILVTKDCYQKYMDRCIQNDVKFLKQHKVVDYSLLLVVNTQTQKIRVNIIDYLRFFTLDKEIEYIYKKTIKLGKVPTIVDPDKYKERFLKQIQSYIQRFNDNHPSGVPPP